MSLSTAVALALLIGLLVYALFGGADFGTGFWSILAGFGRRGAALRDLIDHSIGPVWEANHVWLIYVLVLLWTGFPAVFAATATTLFVPLLLALLGIVARGVGLAFRKHAGSRIGARLYGTIFAGASLLTPYFLGSVAGAVASGRVPADGHGDLVRSWLGPTCIFGGVIAVGTCALLAGVFLTADASRAGDARLADWLRARTLAVGLAVGAVVLAALVPLQHDARTLSNGLTGRGLALIVLSALCGVGTLALLALRRYRSARITALAAVAAVVAGWGVGQWPWLLVDQVRIADGAGARSTLIGLLVVVGLAVVLVLPSLAYLYRLTQTPPWAAPAPVGGPDSAPPGPGLRRAA